MQIIIYNKMVIKKRSNYKRIDLTNLLFFLFFLILCLQKLLKLCDKPITCHNLLN